MFAAEVPPFGSLRRAVAAAAVTRGTAAFLIMAPIFWSEPPLADTRTLTWVFVGVFVVGAAFVAGVVRANGFFAVRRRLGLATPQQLDAVGRALAAGEAALAPYLAPVVVCAADERLRWTDDRPELARAGAIVVGACALALVVTVVTWPGELAQLGVSALPFGVVAARWLLLAPARLRAVEAARAASLARMRPPRASARR